MKLTRFRVLASVIIGAPLFLLAPAAAPQSQPISTFITGIQMKQYEGDLCTINFTVTANGGNGVAPAGSSYIVYVYNEAGQLYTQCSGQLQAPGGTAKCYAEIALVGGYLDIYYNGAPGYTPPYAPSYYMNWQFGGGGSCGN